ncbi:hypothetical protein LJK87_19140 [Paenibacillus sp. P25]|nr:hypothetical protein LJK87_19140 [Paenibacillus sp. P25]
MEKTWYNRSLMSYFPILFITVGMLIFVSVSMISEFSINETEKANRVFSKYVIDSMETSLRGIERVVLEETGNNSAFYNFFEMKDSSDTSTVYYETSKELHKMLDDNPMIHSIYLYRAKDRVVLTTNSLEKLDSFQDKDFVNQALAQPAGTLWSSVRDYSDLSLQPKDKVISISKKALLPFGNQGIIVVNVRLDQLLRIVDEMINPNITFMDISDASGKRVYPIELAGQPVDPKRITTQGDVITNIHSNYIGWNFVSGIKGGQTFSWVSAISHIWIGIGVLTVLISILYTIYVSRRNYKPIESILQQINAYQSRSQLKGKGGDEFSFIGKVLESLMDQTSKYEKQYQEDLLVRRKQFFQELITGRTPVKEEIWAENMNRFKLESAYSQLRLGIAEIDGYAAFRENYSMTDRNLLKFAITNVVHEFSDPEGLTVWAEWVTDKRLAVLFIVNADDPDKAETIPERLDRFRTWVAVNLKFSLTVGVGRTVSRLAEISDSYDEAEKALQYKMSLGGNQVIRYDEIGRPAGDTHKYFQQMDALCQAFRIADDSWRLQVDQLVHDLEQDLLKEEEIRHLLRHLLRLLQRTVEGPPPEMTDLWSGKVNPGLTGAIEESETSEELLCRCWRSCSKSCTRNMFPCASPRIIISSLMKSGNISSRIMPIPTCRST